MPSVIRKIPIGDNVNNPKHYLSPKPVGQIFEDWHKGSYYLQALDVIKAWEWEKCGFMFNVLKYILRAGRKDAAKLLEDLKKARFYLDEKITSLEGEINEKSHQATSSAEGDLGEQR